MPTDAPTPRFSLFARFCLLLSFCLIISVGTFFVAFLNNARKTAILATARTADETAIAVIGNVQRLMSLKANDPASTVRTMLDGMSARQDVSSLALWDKEGRATLASPRLNEGYVLKPDAPLCRTCHREPKPGLEMSVDLRFVASTIDGLRHLTLVRSIEAQPGCFKAGCHAQDRDRLVLGTLTLDVPLAPALREASATAYRSLMPVLPAILLVLAGFAAFISIRLTAPLTRITEALRNKSKGAPWSGLNAGQSGELRELAETVNVIADSVTQRRLKMDEHLSMYQSLFDGVPCLITVQDSNLRLLRYNKLFGESFDAKPVEHCYKVYKGRNEKCESCPVERTFRDGKSHTTEEEGFYKDGSPAFWIVRTAPVRDSNGKVVAVMEMCLDITERKELEKKLKKSERKYAAIFDSMPVVVFELDAVTLEMRNCNRYMSKLYGFSKGEMIGKSFTILFDPDSSYTYVEDLLNQRSITQAKHMDKDGKEIFVSIDSARTSTNGKDILLTVVTDVTDRIRTEQQVIQSSKMATLGEMAAGVAHELNQPLAVLKMVANYFVRRSRKGECPDLEQLLQMANKITNSVDRATKIIEHMREFGRKTNLESREVLLNDVLRRACDFFSEQLKIRDIKVEWKLDLHQPPVLVDPNRLEQVFINLLVNARDAIDDKCLDKPCSETDRVITLRTRSNVRQVIAEVLDTGPGIPKEIIGRIFEPFFSTKEVGRGTGLGLSICYDIVTDYEGTIHVVSKPGQDTRFVIALPIAGIARNGTK